jgi:hypothetical protein
MAPALMLAKLHAIHHKSHEDRHEKQQEEYRSSVLCENAFPLNSEPLDDIRIELKNQAVLVHHALPLRICEGRCIDGVLEHLS